MTILAAASSEGDFFVTDLFFPILVILVVIALLIGSIALVRKRMMAAEADENDPMAGFSLSNLRQLVKQGKMSQAEYDAAKSQIVAAAQRASERQNPVKNPAPDTKLDPEKPI